MGLNLGLEYNNIKSIRKSFVIHAILKSDKLVPQKNQT